MTAAIPGTLCPRAERFIGSLVDKGHETVYSLLSRARDLFLATLS